jgi:hypothetical protein
VGAQRGRQREREGGGERRKKLSELARWKEAPAELAHEGEKIRKGCVGRCEAACLEPSDCWQIPPVVHEGNETAWELYQLFETRWVWGAAGYRSSYDYSNAMQLAAQVGVVGVDLLDLVERIKVVESTVLSIEAERYDLDEATRKREAGNDQVGSGKR